jgi:arginyl-tRNA synthetase
MESVCLCNACRLRLLQTFQIYDTLNIKGLVERGESFYNPFLKGVVEDLENQGFAVESEGATAVFLEGVS